MAGQSGNGLHGRADATHVKVGGTLDEVGHLGFQGTSEGTEITQGRKGGSELVGVEASSGDGPLPPRRQWRAGATQTQWGDVDYVSGLGGSWFAHWITRRANSTPDGSTDVIDTTPPAWGASIINPSPR